MEKTADNADARSRSRSSSLFCLRQNLLRSRFGAAKIFSKAKSNAKAAAAAAREWNERERRTRATSSSQEHIPVQVVRRVAAAEGCVCVVCVFFFPNVSKNTCKHPPPNTRYISSAEFSKTAVVKNNPMKKTVQLKSRRSGFPESLPHFIYQRFGKENNSETFLSCLGEGYGLSLACLGVLPISALLS